MCGRYASARSREDLLETFKIEDALADEETAPDYNVAPTKTSPTVLARPRRGADEDAEPVRQLRNPDQRGGVSWRSPVNRLVPSWAKDPKIGNRMINARAEKTMSKARPAAPLPHDDGFSVQGGPEDLQVPLQVLRGIVGAQAS
jgi:putative SOS response-associated peptidase YedK